MLHPNDFRNVWELSHLWAGFEPAKTDTEELPEPVVDKLQKLIWGYLRGKISLRRKSGRRVIPDDFWLFVFNLNRTRVRLGNAVTERCFEKDFLNSLFVMRSEVLRWCADEFLAPPGIWAADLKLTSEAGDSRGIGGRHRDDEINKLLCQAIARTLWDFDARIHPAHMVEHRAIRRYGNAALYKDSETIRNWIAEVDPLRKERKTGRPPDIRYLIDMGNGGFRADCVIEFKDEKEAS